MVESNARERRNEARDRTARDLARLERHRSQPSAFWRSLSLVGSVGWPIVLLATGGALFGHYLDERFGTSVRLTFILLTLGAGTGSYLAFRALREHGP